MTEETGEKTAATDAVLDAALAHVPFDGWSAATLAAAIGDSGVAPALAHALFPRGGLDLALAYHRRGDQRMRDGAAGLNLAALRVRDRIAALVQLRLEGADREAVRRGSALLALPQHAGEGARALWGTADAIWSVLGDSSDDFAWYTKRATLSGVYGATVLYWLGDDSAGAEATWDFLDRRIAEVMQVEKAKAALRDTGLGRMVDRLSPLRFIRAPASTADLPGGVSSTSTSSPSST